MLICESCNNKCAMNPQTMKQIISFITLNILIILGISAQNQTDTIIYKAKKIYTADTGFTVANAMAVSNGVILHVGSDKTADSLFPNAKVVHFDNDIIYPGFIDAHCHFAAYALDKYKCNLYNTSSYEEIIKKLIVYNKTNPYGWIYGVGWNEFNWIKKEVPSKELLDSLFPNKAVILKRIDGHTVLCNQKALDLAHPIL